MPIYFLVDSITGRQVRVDVETVSCSCTDFRRNLMLYDSGDPRRMCKHLKEAMAIEQMVGRPSTLEGIKERRERQKEARSLQAQR